MCLSGLPKLFYESPVLRGLNSCLVCFTLIDKALNPIYILFPFYFTIFQLLKDFGSILNINSLFLECLKLKRAGGDFELGQKLQHRRCQQLVDVEGLGIQVGLAQHCGRTC